MKTFTKKQNWFMLPVLLCIINLNAQVFWTENFGTAASNGNKGVLANGHNSSNGVYTQSQTGENGTYPNLWYVSSMEAGMGAGNCSSGFAANNSLTNNTLHISHQPLRGNLEALGDFGAVYSSSLNRATDCRIETPVINCTGKSNVRINFDYFSGSSASKVNDKFSLYYYDGSVWYLISSLGASNDGSNSCTGLKQWKSSDSYILPTSADNNSNVKIGFRWENSTNDAIEDTASVVASADTTTGGGIKAEGVSSGNENNVVERQYSVAIDNITVSGSTYVAPNNNASRVSNTNRIDIKTIADKKNNPNIVFTTYSEKFPANDLIVESSTDGTEFNELSKIKSKAVKGSVTKLEYSFSDANANDGVNYYRIKQVNADKTTVISKIVSVDHIKAKNITFTVYPNPNSGQFTVDFSGIENNHEVQIVLNDMNDGHEIYSTTFYSNSIDSNKMDVNPPTKIAPGRYICSLIFEGIRSSVIVMIN